MSTIVSYSPIHIGLFLFVTTSAYHPFPSSILVFDIHGVLLHPCLRRVLIMNSLPSISHSSSKRPASAIVLRYEPLPQSVLIFTNASLSMQGTTRLPTTSPSGDASDPAIKRQRVTYLPQNLFVSSALVNGMSVRSSFLKWGVVPSKVHGGQTTSYSFIFPTISHCYHWSWWDNFSKRRQAGSRCFRHFHCQLSGHCGWVVTGGQYDLHGCWVIWYE